jgi:hypothetical protein
MNTRHLVLLLVALALIAVPGCTTEPDQPQAGAGSKTSERIANANDGAAADAAAVDTSVDATVPDGGTAAGAPPAELRYGATLDVTAARTENPLEDFEPVPEPPPEPEPEGPTGVLDRRDIVAFYGHPFSTGMGILGENSIEDNARRLRDLAAEYDAHNGDRGVVPGFHIIYATATREADVRILQREKLMEYIRFAEENDFVIILDHQLGDYDVVSSVETMFEFLKYDSVHLAFDPEWSTDRPNEVIGSVTAAEVNEVQRRMQEYMIEHGIEGKKMLLVHQFNWRMIQNRERVRADFERIDLVHNADGFGPPADKRASWEYNVRATNMPLKGFKLFLPKSWRDGGYDDPLMTPEEVFSLEPQPVVIQYQ